LLWLCRGGQQPFLPIFLISLVRPIVDWLVWPIFIVALAVVQRRTTGQQQGIEDQEAEQNTRPRKTTQVFRIVLGPGLSYLFVSQKFLLVRAEKANSPAANRSSRNALMALRRHQRQEYSS
jgi:hypothetical protein